MCGRSVAFGHQALVWSPVPRPLEREVVSPMRLAAGRDIGQAHLLALSAGEGSHLAGLQKHVGNGRTISFVPTVPLIPG